MSDVRMTDTQLLAKYKNDAPRDLVAMYEGLADKLMDLGDIRENPIGVMYKPSTIKIVEDYALEAMSTAIESAGYDNDETVKFESYDDDGVAESVGLYDSHISNMRQLMENSAAEVRSVAAANQFNMNMLTPFDAFLPFTIVRSYLPLIGKDLIPTQTPPKDFIRLKQEYKYIVTKDNVSYLRPDVYNDAKASKAILDSAKGARVTQDWFPEGTKASGSPDYSTDDQGYTLPEDLKLVGFDLLEACGGNREIGDDLDINICVNGIRAKVQNKAMETHIVEMTGFQAYPDVTAISPQRSVSFSVKIPVKDSQGKIESYLEDKIYGEFDAYKKTFNLRSLNGYVRQVQFDGNLSNKNNYEYVTFRNEFRLTEHPIPEGYTSQVPITKEDMDLFNRTASIDILAVATNEMTEIFTQLEDGEIISKINDDREKWAGKGEGEHPFEHMHGPIVFEDEVSIARDSSNFNKINAQIQDKMQFAINQFINKMRDTLRAEPFRLVAFAHPNTLSLFTGADNTDWKITPGSTTMGDGIRSDYKMGVTTCNSDSFRILSSQKFANVETDETGEYLPLRFLIYPINEQNFLSWKHFKFSMWFSRDYVHPQMSLVPNIKGYSRFYTHSYIPLQAVLKIRNWKQV